MLDSSASPSVLVVHGPNLNLLGEREPDIYGHTTLAQLNDGLVELGESLGIAVTAAQANGEGQIIDLVHHARHTVAGFVINPGGYTHTSVAIADALRGVEPPVIEVHLSNLFGREAMRHESITASACAGVIMGFGVQSYHLALFELASRLGTTVSLSTFSRSPDP